MANKVFTAFLVVACTGLCVLVLLLARENRRLKGELARVGMAVGAGVGSAPAVTLAVGTEVGPLPLVDAEGAASELAFGEGPATLVLMLSGSCGYCAEALPAWNDLAERAARWGVRAAAVQIDGPPGGNPEYRLVLRTPIAFVPGAAGTWLRGIPSVPAVVLIDGEGVVREVSVAELTPERVETLERAAIAAAAGE